MNPERDWVDEESDAILVARPDLAGRLQREVASWEAGEDVDAIPHAVVRAELLTRIATAQT